MGVHIYLKNNDIIITVVSLSAYFVSGHGYFQIDEILVAHDA